MNVGVNTLFWIPGEVGGSETYLLETLSALRAAYPALQLTLFTNLENDAILRERFGGSPRVTLSRIQCRATNRYQRIIREQTALPRRMRAVPVDLLWSPGYTAPIFSPAPSVLSILDMQYKSFPQDLTLLARLVTDLLVQTGARRSRVILTLSEFARKEILHHTGIPPERVLVTPLAADGAFSNPVADGAQRVRNLLGSDTPYFLAVGNSYPHKHMHVAVDAFRQIMPGIPHRLVLMCKPRLGEPALRTAIDSLPEPQRLTRLQRVSTTDLIALYQNADAFLMPSLYEGFGLPVAEAMLAGTPVIASKCASIPEIGGEAITYAEPPTAPAFARCITEVLDWQPAERRQRIEIARQRAATFTWGRTAALTYSAFETALGR